MKKGWRRGNDKNEEEEVDQVEEDERNQLSGAELCCCHSSLKAPKPRYSWALGAA